MAKRKNQHLPKHGDRAKFVSMAPAMRYWNRWAKVVRGGCSGFVVLEYPPATRISRLEAPASHLLFRRGGIEFSVN